MLHVRTNPFSPLERDRKPCSFWEVKLVSPGAANKMPALYIYIYMYNYIYIHMFGRCFSEVKKNDLLVSLTASRTCRDVPPANLFHLL